MSRRLMNKITKYRRNGAHLLFRTILNTNRAKNSKFGNIIWKMFVEYYRLENRWPSNPSDPIFLSSSAPDDFSEKWEFLRQNMFLRQGPIFIVIGIVIGLV